MTDQQILTKAITKAIENGWDVGGATVTPVSPETITFTSGFVTTRHDVEKIIFDHDFAKALWGDKQLGTDYKDLNGSDFYYEGSVEGLGREAPAYQHHLQQMVIAPDPIKYLEANL